MSAIKGVINSLGIEASAVLLALICCKAAGCQQVPATPKLDRTEFALLVADASSRALDVYSTHRALARGGHEDLLPTAIANHTPTLAAYSAGTVALDWWAARRLERMHHPKLAHIVTMIDLSQDAPYAIRNLFVTPAKATTGERKVGR